MKLLTERKNHITMTVKTDRTEKIFIVDTGSSVTIIPPYEEVKKTRKFHRSKKITGTLIKTK